MAEFKQDTNILTSSYTAIADSDVILTVQNANADDKQVVLKMDIVYTSVTRTLSLTSLAKGGSIWSSDPGYRVPAGTTFTITSNSQATFHCDWTEVAL